MNRLLSLTLIELTQTLHEKKASPVELMSEVLSRIKAVNPEINAVVAQRDPDALMKEAREAEARLSRGQGRPLEGIPLGVKDLENVRGMATTRGSKPLADKIATIDSTQVARFKSKGAIVVGKTNTPEFGSSGITKNLLYGVTRSPWNPYYTPGGSSGGSAAAIAAEMLPLVTASDGGGSIRIPASFVGAYGHKPSFGRIPLGPLETWEYGESVVCGPLTKTVEDAAFFLDQVSGHDIHDPRSLPAFHGSFLQEARKPLDQLKIAYSSDLGYAVVQSDVAQVAEEAAKVFESLGHRVEPISGGPPDAGLFWGLFVSYEVGSWIARFRPHRDADFTRSMLEVVDMTRQGIDQPLLGKISSTRVSIVNWCADLFSNYDLLLTPTVPYDPPPAKGPFPKETEGRAHTQASVAYFTIPFNLSFNPAATVRAGFSNNGLPVGLQIVAPLHRDDLLLRAARAFERERPWNNEWPMR
ncbi:MAG: amidase [Deltaproteobacteria bacterium]|nr:amidase [Deltaproteobacteria bacterium]